MRTLFFSWSSLVSTSLSSSIVMVKDIAWMREKIVAERGRERRTIVTQSGEHFSEIKLKRYFGYPWRKPRESTNAEQWQWWFLFECVQMRNPSRLRLRMLYFLLLFGFGVLEFLIMFFMLTTGTNSSRIDLVDQLYLPHSISYLSRARHVFHPKRQHSAPFRFADHAARYWNPAHMRIDEVVLRLLAVFNRCCRARRIHSISLGAVVVSSSFALCRRRIADNDTFRQ